MATKDRIVKTALELFLKKGLHQVSMQEIASRVGISKPAIYFHFKNKDDMIIGVMDYFESRMAEWRRGYYKGDEAYKEFLELFFSATPIFKNIETVLLNKRSRIKHSFNEFLLAAAREIPDFKQRMAETVLETLRQNTQRSRDAQSEGLIRPDLNPATLALMIHALVEGLSFIYEVIPEEGMEERIQEVFDLFWRLIERPPR